LPGGVRRLVYSLKSRRIQAFWQDPARCILKLDKAKTVAYKPARFS
jgi:hypothetical protein